MGCTLFQQATAQQPSDISLKVPPGDSRQEPQYSSGEAKAPNSQGYGSHNLDSHTYRLPELGQSSDQTHLQSSLQRGYQEHSSPSKCNDFSLRFDASKDGTVGYQDTGSRYDTSVPHALPERLHVSSNPTYTNVGILSLENGSGTLPQSYSYLRERDSEIPVNTSDDHMAAHSTSNYFRTPVKDSISQTDYAFSGANVYESYEPANFAGPYQPEQSSRITSCQNQGSTSHPLTRETRSLRKDINDIVLRKQALDSRLQSLIAHRAVQKEMEWAQASKSKDKRQLARSQSLEDDSRRLKGKLKKYRSRSKSQEDEVDPQSRMSSSVKDCYLSMISEDQDEFPSLQMGSLENEEKISELRNEEADLPGLGDSGLSSEINSINATIQELVRENQQLHEFLQGMTVESIAKVDQEKIELEAKIQSLNQENESLKIMMNGNIEEETNAGAKKKHEGKAVSFLVSDDSVEKLLKENEMESAHCQEFGKKSPVLESEHVEEELTNIAGSSQRRQEAPVDSQEHSKRIAVLEAQVSELTRQNQSLMHKIREERDGDASDKDLQSDYEETSSRILELKTQGGASMSVTREIEKLQRKINKLLREKDDLNHKLNTEATERDYEHSRLEARIRILSEQNRVLNDKLNEQKSASSGTDHGSYHSDQIKSQNDSSVAISLNQDKFEKSTDECKSAMNMGTTSSREVSFKIDVDYDNLTEDEHKLESMVGSKSSSSRQVSEHSRSRSTEYSSSRGDAEHTQSRGSADYSSTKEGSEYTRSKTEPEYSHTEAEDARSQRSANYSKQDPEYSSFTRDSKSEYTEYNASSRSHKSDRSTKKSTAFGENDEYSQVDDDSSTNIEHSLHTENVDQSQSQRPSYKPSISSERSQKTYGNESYDRKKDRSSPETLNGNNQKGKTDEVKPYTIVQPVNDPKLTSQLEELLKQNEMLISTVNAMKATTVMSESSLGSAMRQIMEEHEKLMQNIEEKISHARVSGELDAESRMNKLLQEKQLLVMSLEEQKHKNESLVKQNDLLEKKLQLVRKNSKELLNADQETSEKDKEVLCYVKTPPTLCIASEEMDAPYDIEVDCEIIESFKVSEEIVNGSDDFKKKEMDKFQQNKMGEAIFKASYHSMQRKEASKSTDIQKQVTKTTTDSQSKGSSRRNSLSMPSLSRRGSQASTSRIPKSEDQEHEEELQDELTEGLIHLTSRKEDEKWAQVLEQSGTLL